MGERFWLSDVQWAALEPLLTSFGGKPRVDDRRVISGILHRYREGLHWRAIPDEYGPRTTLFNRFNRWSERGLWQALLAEFAACADPPELVPLDSTTMKAHRAAAGAKTGEQDHAIGASRGGRGTKLHALADGQGRLYRTAGMKVGRAGGSSAACDRGWSRTSDTVRPISSARSPDRFRVGAAGHSIIRRA